jgi:hypothetical protein
MKTCLAYIGHLIVAIIGTVIIETALWPILGKPSSPGGVVMKEFIMSAVLSLALGVVNALWKPSRAAFWIWVAPVALLLLRAILFETASRGSVIAGSDTIWSFFGLDMSKGVSRAAMTNYSIFIIPTVRTAAYSLGAIAVASMSHLRLKSTAEQG